MLDLHTQEVAPQQVAAEPPATSPVPVSEPEPELFGKYEIRNWEFSPKFYKILAGSAALNLLAIFIFGQTNLLTTKGCDSPFVEKVCQVLDTVYVGSILLGTDPEFVSKDYEKTELEDADITYINVGGGEEPLKYPDGYFALANPESALQQPAVIENPIGFQMPPTGSFSPITPSSRAMNGTDLTTIKPTLPPPINDPVVGELPKSPLGGFPAVTPIPNRNFPRIKTPRPPRPRYSSPAKLPDLTAKAKSTPEEDEKEKTESLQPDISSLAATSDAINKKPLQDFGDEVLTKVEAKQVDLTKPFTVVLQGTITKEGTFNRDNSSFTRTEGDKKMVELAQKAIQAIGDSGLLRYLTRLDVEKVNFTLVQDDTQIYAVITSSQNSDALAKTTASGLNTLISAGKMSVKEDDTLILLNAANVESKGKSFTLNFKLDKAAAQDLISRQLEKAQVKRQQMQQQTPQQQTPPPQPAQPQVPPSGATAKKRNQNTK